MSSINRIGKKFLLPLAASTMLATAPCKAQNNRTDEITQEETFEIKTSPKTIEGVGIGLFMLGIAGAGVLGKKCYKTYKTKEAEAEAYNKKCLDMIDKFYMEEKYENSIERRAFIEELKSQMQKPYGYRTSYKHELLKQLNDLYQASEYVFLENLPSIRYKIDKISANPTEWQDRINKYPKEENTGKNNTNYTNHINNCINILHGINAAAESNKVALLTLNLSQLKSEFLNFGVFDEYAFREAINIIDMILSYLESESLYKVSKNTIINNLKNLTSEYLPLVLGVNKSKISSILKNNPTNNIKTSSTQNNNNIEEIDKQNIIEEDDEEYEEIQIGFEKGDMKVGFKDIGGQDEVIKQLSRKVLFPLKYPKAFENQKINKGVILYGPPGTGKTLLALALANEADAKFIKMNGLELIDQYVGTSERNFRNLFLEARKEEPCIIFLDEFDAIARKRSGDTHGRHDDKVVNQLLTLLSDLEKENVNIFVITATNRLDIIDPALLRNGRIGTHIEVGLATTPEAVEQILDIHLKNKPVRLTEKDEVIKALIAKKASGADIASIVNSALENAYERTGIYEKMSKGSFKNKDLKHLVITTVDINKAINDFKSDEKNKTIRPIGFNKI